MAYTDALLGSATQSGAGTTTLYTCPAATEAVIRNLHVFWTGNAVAHRVLVNGKIVMSHTPGDASTYSATLAPFSGSSSTTAPGTTGWYICGVENHLLEAGDTVQIYSGGAGGSITDQVSGIVIT